ncbi:MAG: ribose-phosphate pyrophosphokinase [Neisseriaceae bacterium]|nr:MAG: ribose-phosphate pyrophosphokinase [Neisseriaceae bacterium]
MNDLRIFGLGSSQDYADKMCSTLQIRRSHHEESWQDDDEPYVVSKENVRGCDVFIVSSLHSCEKERLSDKFLKLLLFARSLRDASARRITLVCPYLSYQRQDRKTESRAPVYTKYIPELIEGLLRPDDRILTMDAHNLSAYQSGFRIMLDHLEAKNLISDWFSRNLNKIWGDVENTNLCFVSPDEGGVKRIGFYRKKIQSLMDIVIDTASVYKTHEAKEIVAHGIMGNVKNKDVFIGDDMVSSGKTLVEAFNAITKESGRVRAAIATHGLFVGEANKNIGYLMDNDVKIVVTDTVQSNKLEKSIRDKLIVIPTDNMFAEAVRCIHNEESISRLIS